VHFYVDVGARLLHAEVTAYALIEHFGATESPSTWVQAFKRHKDEIEARALSLWRDGALEPMCLEAQHFRDLTRTGGSAASARAVFRRVSG
jgi:hypothetical protein